MGDLIAKLEKLTEYELSVLRMMDGGPNAPWGAAMSAALEFLKGDGLIEQTGTRYDLTDAGRAALRAKEAQDG